MGNVVINNVGTESVNQTGQVEYLVSVSQEGLTRGYLTRRPYPRDTRKTQLSPSDLTLHIPIMCKTHASFRRMLSRELLAKPLQASVA